MKTIAEGKAQLERLLSEINNNAISRNESETRFHIIDRIIIECLGWPRDKVHVEQPLERTFTDYELGEPRRSIWEAKREGRIFELPADPNQKLVVDLPSVMSLGGEVAEAIRQVQRYCSERGVEVAVATNGPQLIAFLATRNDGKAPLKGRCLVTYSYKHLLDNFPKVWQMLSPAGIAERRLNRLLNVGQDASLPDKMSAYLLQYPLYRYSSDLQSSLRTISDILLVDVVEQPEVERSFYEKCYCESGALSQHALVSKAILSSRYAAIFTPSEPGPAILPIMSGRGKPALTPSVMAESYSQRPLVLIGDVGVGKTSFLKHLIYVSAFEEFKKSVYIYIDLGSRGALASEMRSFVLNEVENQLLENYDIDVQEGSFVKAVYNKLIKRFDNGIYAPIKTTDPQIYQQKLFNILEDAMREKDKHLKECISHIALGRKLQVIIIIDNADQRDFNTQQDAFIIAQNFAKDWHAAVFIAVRPQTFYHSKQSGALTAYPHRVFAISPPRVDVVIERRLKFALDIAEEKYPVERIKDVGVRLPTIALFLKALIYSLGHNQELVEFLSNITGGNIRKLVELVTKFIGSPNVDAEKIINIMEKENKYIVPVHEFWKAAMLGDSAYYHSLSSIALNLFDIGRPDPREHFLLPMMLGYMDAPGLHGSKEGFVDTVQIIAEMQNWGYVQDATQYALRRANNKKLIETPKRVTFEEDEGGLVGEMPEKFRINTIGAYHLKRWLTQFSYLDAMSIDTPIMDEDACNAIRPTIESFAIKDRLQRALAFRYYLTNRWFEAGLEPTYFDWPTSVKDGQHSFISVQNAIENHPGRLPSYRGERR